MGFFSFCLGTVIASFLNVVIWRMPRGESIVFPPSHCPNCNAAVRWYQNIPIVSWLALRGRCANCRAPISPRYLVVEFLGGCLFLAAFGKVFGWQPSVAALLDGWVWLRLSVLWLWISLMIVGSAIDFDYRLLPDFVTVGGMVLGVVWHAVESLSLFLVRPGGAAGSSASLVRALDCPVVVSLLGLAFGFGLLGLVRYLGSKAFRREAMGLGDVFLLGAVGALFGPTAVLVTLIVSSVLGSIVGLSLVALSKAKLGKFVEIPYGPYLCLGCLVWMFCGRELVTLYLSWVVRN